MPWAYISDSKRARLFQIATAYTGRAAQVGRCCGDDMLLGYIGDYTTSVDRKPSGLLLKSNPVVHKAPHLLSKSSIRWII